MAKRIGFLYNKMCNKDMIREAIRKGSIGKKRRHDVKTVMANPEKYVDKIYDLLIRHAYVPTKPKQRVIFDKSCGKQRTISIVPFYPDGIMHQLIVMAMTDVLMRGMYRWSCASIPGRGNACARKYVRRALDKSPKLTKYAAKLDIYHYYPSIPIDRLMNALSRKIKDRAFLDVIERILRSNPGSGLAIGYYINQWLANYYLEPLDNYICTLDGVRYYVRNMDDMIIIGPNKRKLHRAVAAISEYLSVVLGLRLKENYQVFPTDSRGIDIVGYRFFHSHTRLRRKTFLRFTRQCRKIQKIMARGGLPTYHMACSILSRAGNLKHCDCVQARRRYFGVLNGKAIRRIVRKESKRQHELLTNHSAPRRDASYGA